MLTVFIENEEERKKLKKFMEENGIKPADGTVAEYYNANSNIAFLKNEYFQNEIKDRIVCITNMRKDIQGSVINGKLEYIRREGNSYLKNVTYRISGVEIDKIDYEVEEFNYYQTMGSGVETKWVYGNVDTSKMPLKTFHI